MTVQYVVTLVVPFCGLLAPCPAREALPFRPEHVHVGDCLGLQHLPVGATNELRQDQLPGGGRTTWPCGGKAR